MAFMLPMGQFGLHMWIPGYFQVSLFLMGWKHLYFRGLLEVQALSIDTCLLCPQVYWLGSFIKGRRKQENAIILH